MIRLALRVPREHAELILAELLELVPDGFEERDLSDELVEYAVYGPPGELPSLPDLTAACGPALLDVRTTEIADDWPERWKSFHRPILVELADSQPSPRLHVRPPWEPPSDLPGTIEIAIDPGQAFGTGAHHTTRLCLELLLLLRRAEPGALPLLDLGTGSGVLAIAAAKLGFDPVLGLDNDPESISAARDNAALNGVEIALRRHDLRSESLPRLQRPTSRADDLKLVEQLAASPVDQTFLTGMVLTANLLRPLLLELAGSLQAPPAHLIASGLLIGEADEVLGAFRDRLGMRERVRRHSGEWAAGWLQGAGRRRSD